MEEKLLCPHQMVELSIPAGTQPETVLVIKGKGMTVMNAARRGEMRVVVKIEVPVYLNADQKKLIKDLDQSLKPETTPQNNNFFNKVKRMFEGK
ncbi:MAG: hypothetical protein EBT45_09280 [Alphaproteobacteria bacterium]|nr:hypothetical protein [Alphaproteobacteria bacterium]